MGIEGIPIYSAPNASPHIERLMRTFREEALNHFIFLTADHIRRVVREYVRYYNGARPSQAIHAISDPYPELREPPLRGGTERSVVGRGGALYSMGHRHRRPRPGTSAPPVDTDDLQRQAIPEDGRGHGPGDGRLHLGGHVPATGDADRGVGSDKVRPLGRKTR